MQRTVEMTDRGKIISLVPVFLIAMGFLFQHPYSVLVGIGMISLILYSRFQVTRDIDLEVECEYQSGIKSVGEDFQCRQKIHSDRPLYIDIEPNLDKDMKATEGGYSGTLDKIIEHKYKITPQRRGYHKIGGLEGWIYEPLKLYKIPINHEPKDEMVVHSSKEAIRKAHQYSRRSHHEFLTEYMNRFFYSTGDFDGFREYQPGDSMRDIHWKASSKLQKLITKVHESEALSQCRILLDCSPSMRRKSNDSSTKLDHSIYLALELLKNFELSGHEIGMTVFDHKKTILHQEPDHKRETFTRLYNETTDLPGPIDVNGYRKRKDGEIEVTRNKKVTERLSSYMDTTHSYKLSGILSAVRLMKREGKTSLVIIISDLENSPTRFVNAVKKLKEMNNQVWVIVPFSPWYEVNDIDGEVLEKVYEDYEVLEKHLEKINRLEASVFLIHPTEEGFTILERGVRNA